MRSFEGRFVESYEKNEQEDTMKINIMSEQEYEVLEEKLNNPGKK